MDESSPAPKQDQDREFFLIGERGYNNLITWKLIITPEQVLLVPAETSWGCLISFNILCLVFMIGWCTPVYLYAEEGPRIVGLIIGPLVMIATGAGVTTLALREYWRQQAFGPWLIIDRVGGTVCLPRQGVMVPLDQVVHLESISGSHYEQSRWSERKDLSELNIVLREGDETRRYSLLGFVFGREFDSLARQIADLDLIPVKRVYSQWDPRRIYETWMEPRG